jgi:hypothetical protein
MTAAIIMGTYNGAYHTLFFTVPMAIIFFVLFKKSKTQDKKEDIETWIKDNHVEIIKNGAKFKGHHITLDTVLVKYTFVVSFILVTLKIPSRWYIKDSENIQAAKFGFILGTLFCGWWGFPWGPIYTVVESMKNIFGGTKVRVQDILGIEAVEQLPQN